ncbi:hypothetical protein FHT67_004290 [Paenibacillus sp. BK720]|nr:hypothetical protein [Paenibacillus sp. BK720]
MEETIDFIPPGYPISARKPVPPKEERALPTDAV